MICPTFLPPSGSISSGKTPVRGRPHCSVLVGAKPPYSSACCPTTSRAGGPYATSTVPSLFGPPFGGHGAAVATSSCGAAASYGRAHFPTHRTCPLHAPPVTDGIPGPTPCGAVADRRPTTDASRAPSSTCSPSSSGHGLLGNRHQLSAHLAISGRLRSVHCPSAEPAKTAPIQTGGLRRMVTIGARF